MFFYSLELWYNVSYSLELLWYNVSYSLELWYKMVGRSTRSTRNFILSILGPLALGLCQPRTNLHVMV